MGTAQQSLSDLSPGRGIFDEGRKSSGAKKADLRGHVLQKGTIKEVLDI